MVPALGCMTDLTVMSSRNAFLSCLAMLPGFPEVFCLCSLDFRLLVTLSSSLDPAKHWKAAGMATNSIFFCFFFVKTH